MTSTDMLSPRARAIINAASALVIPHEEIIGDLQERLGDAIAFPLVNSRDCLFAIASPLFSGDDDFDDLIHEIAHCLESTLECEECAGECDLCCDC